MVLPYSAVRHLAGLRLSPIGVVPQDGRRPRVIVDYTYWGINAATLPLAAGRSMQFGRTNERLQQTILWTNPRNGKCYAYKVDISDGFYRVPLTPSASLRLGVVLPPLTGTEPLIAFPLVLPMGWAESPPFFCEFTETACDLTNRDFHLRRRYPEHPLESRAGQADYQPHVDHGEDGDPGPPSPSHLRLWDPAPTAAMDVYVDDFCGIGQDHPSYPIAHQRRALLHNIDKVFRPNDTEDHAQRKQPISVSKLDKGDAAFSTIKRCLGWDYCIRSKTLRRTPQRERKVRAALAPWLTHRRTSRTAYQSALGQLRSLVPGVPGLSGQFSRLQQRLTLHQGRIPLDEVIRADAAAIITLLDDPTPTRLDELVPGIPAYTGACDAAKPGMGGVWFGPTLPHPLLWRTPFPDAVQAAVISDANPSGTLTNSDLELAGTIAHQAVLGLGDTHAGDTVHIHCDNTPAVSWRSKGSSTTTKPRSGLLKMAALLRRRQRTNLRITHLAGSANRMADDASRLWSKTDAELLTYFNSTYPQATAWRFSPVPAALNSNVLSTLSPETSPAASALAALAQRPPPGPSGAASAPSWAPSPASPTSPTPSRSSCCLLGSGAKATSHQKATMSGPVLPRMRYDLWARRSPQWGPATPGSTHRAKWTTASPANWPGGVGAIHRAGAGQQFRLRYSGASPTRRTPTNAPVIWPQPISCGSASLSSSARANTSTQAATAVPRP